MYIYNHYDDLCVRKYIYIKMLYNCNPWGSRHLNSSDACLSCLERDYHPLLFYSIVQPQLDYVSFPNPYLPFSMCVWWRGKGGGCESNKSVSLCSKVRCVAFVVLYLSQFNNPYGCLSVALLIILWFYILIISGCIFRSVVDGASFSQDVIENIKKQHIFEL